MLGIIRNSKVVSQMMENLASQPATFLIPSNQAWNKFREALPNADVLFQNQQLLSEFIAFHVLIDPLSTTDTKTINYGSEYKTMHRDEPLVVLNNTFSGDFFVRDQNKREAGISGTSLKACGSHIHIIDDVLIPSTTSLPFQCLKFILGGRPETTRMLELIESSPTLQKLFEDASLEPHTYFIPSNQAWNAFKNSQRNGDALFGNEQLLAEFVAYHLVAQRGELADLDKSANSLHLGEAIKVKKDDKKVVDFNGNEAKIIMADIQACGSVLNVIDRVLVPSTTQFPEECLMQTLGSRDDTSTMLDIIKSTDLFQLIKPANHTYFIPSNSAWEQFRSSLRNAPELFDNQDLLSEYILYHVLQKAVDLGDLEKSAAPTMHLGETVKVQNGDRVVDNNDYEAAVLQGDIKVCSSIVHVIDRVLMPTTSLFPYECLTFALGSRKDTSTFLKVIRASNILQAVMRITSMLPHTYLVPNGQAFINLLSSMEDPSILMGQDQLLAEIISYHMIAGSLSTNAMLLAKNVTTKHLGETMNVVNGDGPEVIIMDNNGRDTNVVNPDFQACNSTIHVVDEILVPSTTKSPLECLHFAFETLPGTQAFSSLIKNSTGVRRLLEELALSEPHTFLVPSNQAVEEFIALLKAPQSLFNDDQVLEELIKYHVVTGALTTEELYNTRDIETLLFEEPIEFDIKKNIQVDRRGPTDTDSVVLLPNIRACNSTMHIIDHMLYPAITSIQGLLNSEDGFFRSLVLIPETPLISFKNVENYANELLGIQAVAEEDEQAVEIPVSPQVEHILTTQLQ
eukprot:TRINITY_DN39195_c0_g1_i2.p1 TRINITY_DN39195_c0_g1~~TRINITY_DN39195_c0_g1_i2.p1  ORF type:complete len:796 (+),score=147.72 TRINITY_DN39195_c0_g1_i2:153-2540(+)